MGFFGESGILLPAGIFRAEPSKRMVEVVMNFESGERCSEKSYIFLPPAISSKVRKNFALKVEDMSDSEDDVALPPDTLAALNAFYNQSDIGVLEQQTGISHCPTEDWVSFLPPSTCRLRKKVYGWTKCRFCIFRCFQCRNSCECLQFLSNFSGLEKNAVSQSFQSFPATQPVLVRREDK